MNGAGVKLGLNGLMKASPEASENSVVPVGSMPAHDVQVGEYGADDGEYDEGL